MLVNSHAKDILMDATSASVEEEEEVAIGGLPEAVKARFLAKAGAAFKVKGAAWSMWKCIGIAAACLVLGSAAAFSAGYERVNVCDIRQSVDGQSAVTPLLRLQAKTAVDPVANLLPEQIAGQYANPSKELVKHVGPPLVGNNLYLFPDKTYVYCEWAVVMPTTVFDKGTWSFAGGLLELTSDQIVTWNPDLERRFLVVRRTSHAEEILLVGAEQALRRFERQAEGDPELMLLTIARQRIKTISRAEAAALKTTLLRRGWRPDSFGKAGLDPTAPANLPTRFFRSSETNQAIS
jgi:hypothetical protein